MESVGMKALAKLRAEPGIWMTDVPEPEYGCDEILIKIKKAAICGSDVHIYAWDDWVQNLIPVPIVIGHEYAGEVIAVGKDVTDFKIGDRVSGEGHITCGSCSNCLEGKQHLCPNTIGIGVQRAGAFAEYLALPASNAFKIPDNISDNLAAIFDPFGNAVHTAMSFDLACKSVLITGAGPIGAMAAQVALHCGARHVVITDINDYRLSLVSSKKNIRTVNIQKESLENVMSELEILEGFDVALEMSGVPSAFAQILDTTKNGANVALLGLLPDQAGIDWTKVIFKSITLKGIYGRQMFRTWHQMTNLIQSGLDISPIITHELPFSDFQKGFDLMTSGQSGKIILNLE